MIYPNPMAKYKDGAEKSRLFNQAVKNNESAAVQQNIPHTNLGMVPLSELCVDNVEYISGAWRVQTDFPHQIQQVRDRLFVIGERLNIREPNLFEYYAGYPVQWNCYGPSIGGSRMIIGKCETDTDTLWSYSPSVEGARAFMAIALFDRNRDLIYANERKNYIPRSSR